MLTEERHKIILDTLAKDNIVKLQDLVDQTGSSESTIRRDLSTLEEAGFLIRVHGGAKRNYSVSAEDRMEDKTSKNVQDKQRIAEKAARISERSRHHLFGCRIDHLRNDSLPERARASSSSQMASRMPVYYRICKSRRSLSAAKSRWRQKQSSDQSAKCK